MATFAERLKAATGGDDGLSFEERLAQAQPQFPHDVPSWAAPRRRGDAIDQLAARRGGTLPARDEAITRPTTPDDIQFAAGQDVNGGASGGFASSFDWLRHPLTTLDNALDAAGSLTVMGGPPLTTSDAVRAANQATLGLAPTSIPTAIADTASESYARTGRNESRADMYGNLGGMALQALIGKGVGQYVENVGNRAAIAGELDPAASVPKRVVRSLAPAGRDTLRQATGRGKPSPRAINTAIGSGAVDSRRGIDVGNTLLESNVPVDEAAVRADPRALIDHTQGLLDREHANIDNLLTTHGGDEPSVHGPSVVANVRSSVPLVAPGDLDAANNVDSYVQRRIGELSQRHGAGNNRGMISARDAQTLKRELQLRTNYDKIFGAGNLTTTDAIRNELLGRYSAALDQVGDTIPGYADANARSSAYLQYLNNNLYDAVDTAATGGEKASTIAGTAKLVGGKLLQKPRMMASGMADIAGNSGAGDPAKVARALNDNIAAQRRTGTGKASTPSRSRARSTPVAPIAGVSPVTDIAVEPATPTRSPRPSAADFAASDKGSPAHPLRTPSGRGVPPNQVRTSFPPTGPTTEVTGLEPVDVRTLAEQRAGARTASGRATQKLTQMRSDAQAQTGRLLTTPTGPEVRPTGPVINPTLRSGRNALPPYRGENVLPSSGVVFEADTPNSPRFWRGRQNATPRGVTSSGANRLRSPVDAKWNAAVDGLTRGDVKFPAPEPSPNDPAEVQRLFDKRNDFVRAEVNKRDPRPSTSPATSSVPRRASPAATPPARATASASPVSPSTPAPAPSSPSPSSPSAGSDVRFSVGQRRLHGKVVGPVKSKTPAVLVRTESYGDHAVPLSSLTLLQKP
jgi:hypothetical protein